MFRRGGRRFAGKNMRDFSEGQPVMSDTADPLPLSVQPGWVLAGAFTTRPRVG
jgi:hypothetical protein